MPVKTDTYEIRVTTARPCQHSRKMEVVFDNWPHVTWHSIYQSCSRTEYEAFVDRHLKSDNMAITDEFGRFALNWIDKTTNWHLEPLSDAQLLASRPQRMRKRYTNGLSAVFEPRHARVMMFVKNEKMNLTAGRKPPRAIQYRNSIYTARLAKFTVQLDLILSKGAMKDNYGLPIMTKGRTAIQVGQLIAKAWFESGGEHAYLIDHVAYDAHISAAHLDIEHKYYLKQYNQDSELKELLDYQINNKVMSRNGIKVTVRGCRMSGDANTSLGNSVLNYIMLRYCFPDSIILVNGDDSIVFGGHQAHQLHEVGMVSKVKLANDISQLEYCQQQPVLTDIGYVMMRDPWRVLNRAAIRLSAGNIKDWLLTVGIGEAHACPYDPISQALATRFRELGLGAKFRQHFMQYRHNMAYCPDIIPATSKSILGWQESFGIDTNCMNFMIQCVKNMVLYNG